VQLKQGKPSTRDEAAAQRITDAIEALRTEIRSLLIRLQ
jgi:hypothetical protein